MPSIGPLERTEPITRMLVPVRTYHRDAVHQRIREAGHARLVAPGPESPALRPVVEAGVITYAPRLMSHQHA
jgi:hypothetical protein